MGDDKSNRGSPDQDRISTSEDYEVRDWAKKFGVSKEELLVAVKSVGNSADKVKAYLANRKQG